MATPAAALKDFFISYNKADRVWAEWIAWQLEAAGYATIIQAWDFLAGGNFMAEMDAATKTTHHMIAVLSPDYLKSGYTRLEWTAALARDPTSAQRPVISVRVRDLGEEFSGLLAVIAYVDLLGLGEDAARERLLAQASGKRGKPAVAPVFPGLMQQVASPPVFPGQPPLWLVPHRRNNYFTGREETLKHLRAAFAAGQGIVTQAITGLGGMGKTQTALEYVYRRQQDYQAVFWAQAETRELLIGDFGKIAALLNLPERDAQNQEEMLAAVTRWLETHAGWLLVLDNVEEATREQEIWPTRGSGHILLTARAQSPGAVEQRSSLQALPLDEAARFLLRRAHLNTEDAAHWAQARAIAEALGSLPLALDQAGAYIDETGCGLKGYLDLYKKQRAALLRRRGEGVTDHPEAVALTWKLAFQKVEQASPAGADLLRLCAFLHPEAIPEDLFRDGAAALTPVLQRAVKDGLQWDEAIAALRRFSLIERQGETLSLHRLVQTVLQDDLSAAARKRWAERAVRLVNEAFPSGEFETWGRCQQLLPHALTCASHIEAWHLASEEAGRLLNPAGYYLFVRAQYVEALPLLQRALAIFEKSLGPDHLLVALTLNN